MPHHTLMPNSGQLVSDSVLQEMIDEAPGPINFTMFLTLFGDRLTGEPKKLPNKSEKIPDNKIDGNSLRFCILCLRVRYGVRMQGHEKVHLRTRGCQICATLAHILYERPPKRLASGSVNFCLTCEQ